MARILIVGSDSDWSISTYGNAMNANRNRKTSSKDTVHILVVAKLPQCCLKSTLRNPVQNLKSCIQKGRFRAEANLATYVSIAG